MTVSGRVVVEAPVSLHELFCWKRSDVLGKSCVQHNGKRTAAATIRMFIFHVNHE